jgi:hypothetical protein
MPAIRASNPARGIVLDYEYAAHHGLFKMVTVNTLPCAETDSIQTASSAKSPWVRLRKGPRDTVMALTDRHIRNAEPKAKPYKLSDGGGRYLLVTPDGARYRRFDYRFAGKRRTLALGVYPTTTLSNARTRRDEAQALLAKGIDPSVAKKAAKRAAMHANENTFEAIAGD